MGSFAFQETVTLVRRTQAGDREAERTLFERYLPRVRQIVALRIGKPMRELSEDEDIVQDSLLDAFRKLQDLEHVSEGSFHNWVVCLVENNIRDHWRRGRAEKRGAGRVKPFADYETSVLAQSIPTGRDPSPSAVARGREMEEGLERALLSLSERHRRVIDLRRLCEMSYAEIAQAMGLGSESSARSLYSRAITELSKRLGSLASGSEDGPNPV